MIKRPEPEVILASASRIRSEILTRAGVPHDVDPARVDEDEVKRSLQAENADAESIAVTLAEIKARHVARRHPDALVLGADQVLDCEGLLFDKPADMDHARAHLMALRGRTHSLISAACVVRGQDRLWHQAARVRMAMRPFSDAFLDDYLDRIGEAALQSVGAYQVEGRGAQLFSAIEGDYFTVLGLPLLPVLEFLRNNGVLIR